MVVLSFPGFRGERAWKWFQARNVALCRAGRVLLSRASRPIRSSLDCAASRSMQIELQADKADGKLFAGAYTRVHFALRADANTVRLPATALVPVNGGAQVALVAGRQQGDAEACPARPGFR